jgi:hypothetical protein
MRRSRQERATDLLSSLGLTLTERHSVFHTLQGEGTSQRVAVESRGDAGIKPRSSESLFVQAVTLFNLDLCKPST